MCCTKAFNMDPLLPAMHCDVHHPSCMQLPISGVLITSLQAAGMLTLDGRCKTLDLSADGYVRGEACIAAYAAFSEVPDDAFLTTGTALCSTFVNQDGRSSSLTAPNGPSQQQVGGKVVPSAGLAIHPRGTVRTRRHFLHKR
jgi:Beta-ketoacyl synthase, N-terminal domain